MKINLKARPVENRPTDFEIPYAFCVRCLISIRYGATRWDRTGDLLITNQVEQVTIELSEDQAAKLQTEAHGLTVERWLGRIAAQLAPSTSAAHLQQTDPKEWGRQFHQWAERHDRTTPLLSGSSN
jgi:hypothetical protein